ncbi:MAG TPA: formate dehydrogenase subunit delta [Rudaea sp.]|jgi:formate dehydrogenase subunit delta|uniref:formate dehydrogenase subunit delta n=1 Tax=Rudaea sp. TaxID=2136325 RepID=UPI002F95404F
MSGAEHLVTMANDIANFFHSESDRQVAVDGVTRHIQRYWEPRMRRKIVAHLAEHNGEGLSDLARLAVARLGPIPKA